MATPISTEPLAALIHRDLPGAKLLGIEAMPGGMSPRRFFRARLQPDSATTPASVVGVFTPNAQQSDEASHQNTEPREWPFLEVHRLLYRAGVRVPHLFGTDCDAGWMLVEDLGDLTLARAVLAKPDNKEGLYQIAVADLARAHAALTRAPEDSVVRTRRFDYALLHWEIEHFREFALSARDFRLSADQAERFMRLSDALAKYVADLPAGFVHRDYQSRNLMWVPSSAASYTPPPTHRLAMTSPTSTLRSSGELVWIDFQDALTGPRIYDLVALLNDSYQTFSRDFVTARLTEYAALRGDPSLTSARAVFEFDVVTVQRKLKDAGRFVYFYVKNGDPSYLEFVDPTISKVKASLARLQHEQLFREWAMLLEELLPGV
jgi:aminoglycoside/choline kinase family phosphotransferase